MQLATADCFAADADANANEVGLNHSALLSTTETTEETRAAEKTAAILRCQMRALVAKCECRKTIPTTTFR